MTRAWRQEWAHPLGWESRKFLEAWVKFHQKPQSPPGTMVVLAQMSDLITAFSGFRHKLLHK